MWILLVPFLLLVLVYGALYRVIREAPLLHAIFKALPLVYLLALVLLARTPTEDLTRRKQYVLLGMILHIIGDAFLTWPAQYFLLGIGFLSSGNVCFVVAAAFKPLGLIIGTPFILLALVLLTVIKASKFSLGLKISSLWMVSMNAISTCILGWRMMVLFHEHGDFDSVLALSAGLCLILLTVASGFLAWFTKSSTIHFTVRMTYLLFNLLLALWVVWPVWEAFRRGVKIYGV